MFMNEYEIDMSVERHADNPVLGKASLFLREFKDVINGCSDGWCYWKQPVNAAKQLMTLIQHPETATEQSLKRALSPIKSFATRRNIDIKMQIQNLES